jgi:transposase
VVPPLFWRLPTQVCLQANRARKFSWQRIGSPVELRERVRLFRESDPNPVMRRLAEQLNVHPEGSRNWIRQAEADRGELSDGPTTEMIAENRRLGAEHRELRRANEVCGRPALRSRRSTPEFLETWIPRSAAKQAAAPPGGGRGNASVTLLVPG